MFMVDGLKRHPQQTYIYFPIRPGLLAQSATICKRGCEFETEPGHITFCEIVREIIFSYRCGSTASEVQCI